ncbi:hypothetical protein V6N13_101266 [Hibiscus sabdariffa]
MFFRIYVCFQALKQGWKDGCRPFIGVDGCWLKSAKKGELLVDVGRDANNQMFLIAWAVVEVECVSSWRWFLKKLFTDLEHPTGEGITLMSDQQKGLVKVLVEDYPDTAYRMCARYLAWELSGIPCSHAICAMYQENKRPEDYVSHWYNKEKYLTAYNHVLQPPGTSTEHVVTRASKRKIGEADPSQFQHHSKGKWLRWKGNAAVTTRQLQENVETVRKKRGRPLKSQTLGAQSSQT